MRIAIIKNILLFSLLLVLFIEIFSFFKIITFNTLLLFLLFYSTYVFYEIRHVKIFYLIKSKINNLSLSNNEYIITLFFLFFIFILFCLSILMPPNNYDSLSYHLPRVEHWIDNKSVYPYSTNIIRQIIHPPLAEYYILILRILTDGDYFSNIVQFSSMIGTLTIATLFAKEFNFSFIGQLFCAIIIFSIPMAILQSTTSQNDYVSSFFFITFLFFLHQCFINNFKTDDCFYLVLSIFLSGLVKYSAIIFCLPFVLFLIFKTISKSYIVYKFFYISFILAFLLYIPFLYRNFLNFGDILGSKSVTNLMSNEIISISSMISNFTKLVFNNLALPYNKWNFELNNLIQNIHNYFNYSLNTNENNFMNIPFNVFFVFHEDYTGSFIHFTLFLSILFIVAFNFKFISKYIILYFILSIFSLLFYSLLFKWQPWANRLVLPMIISLSLFSSLIFYEYLKINNLKLNLIMIIFLISSIPYVFFNPNKSFISKNIIRKFTNTPKSILNNDIIEMNVHDLEVKKFIVNNFNKSGTLLHIKDNLNQKERTSIYKLQMKYGLINNLDENQFLLNTRLENYFFQVPHLLENLTRNSISNKKFINLYLNTNEDAPEYLIWKFLNYKRIKFKIINNLSICKNLNNCYIINDDFIFKDIK